MADLYRILVHLLLLDFSSALFLEFEWLAVSDAQMGSHVGLTYLLNFFNEFLRRKEPGRQDEVDNVVLALLSLASSTSFWEYHCNRAFGVLKTHWKNPKLAELVRCSIKEHIGSKLLADLEYIPKRPRNVRSS